MSVGAVHLAELTRTRICGLEPLTSVSGALYRNGMETSRLFANYRTTIPADVRAALGVKPGDQLAWSIKDGKANVSRVRPFDAEWHDAISVTFADEWLSDEDEVVFRDL